MLVTTPTGEYRHRATKEPYLVVQNYAVKLFGIWFHLVAYKKLIAPGNKTFLRTVRSFNRRFEQVS